MPVETIYFNGQQYPAFQSKGFAAKFAFPFAELVCSGKGLDVGCNRKEWAFPSAIPIDPLITPEYDAFKLPHGKFDYIFSSHMLEHIIDWVSCLDYWFTKIKNGGCVYLYLPSYSQHYWRPWHNRKHVNIFTPEILRDYFTDRGWENIKTTGDDANNSFTVIAYKPEKLSSIGVYSITNLYNNKRYIGSTSVSFFERFKKHKHELFNNCHHSYLLQRSFNKRGINAFRFEIIEDCAGVDKKTILEKENYYINYYDSANNGYNVNPMSTGNSRTDYQDLLLYTIDGDFVDRYKSSIEVSKAIGVKVNTIQSSYKRQAIGKYSSIKNKWIVIQEKHIRKAVFKYPYTIYEVDENNNDVESFYKYADAGKKFNVSRECIRRIINKNIPTSDGTYLVLKNRKYEKI